MSAMSNGGFSSLPTELWLAVIDAILANTAGCGRWRDLAHLAWTCRGAYMAARGPLWKHLRLMFRINTERILAPNRDNDNTDLPTKHRRQTAFRHHQRVLESSVFPRFQVGQLSLESERLARIRQVSHQYPHLQPFVVLEGKLYLASLVEHERDPSAPNFAGITSLWGDDEESSVSAGARVVGGLVLVPYPLRWAAELTVDALGSGDDIGDCPLTFKSLHSHLGFIFGIDRNQIRTMHFYTDSGQGTWSIYRDLGIHFSGVVEHDYFLAGGEHYCPPFGESTRNVQLFHTESFDNDQDLFVTLSNAPIVSFEQYGSGCLDLRFGASRFMVSPTLTRLVLDCDLYASGTHEPFEMHLPALEQFTLTFQVAEILFDFYLSDTMFPMSDAPTPAINTRTIFPALTHLTLLDVKPDGTDDRATGEMVYVPWIPHHHMPRLSHFHIPSAHRGFQNRHAMRAVELQLLLTQTRLQSLIALRLERILHAVSDPDVTALPVAAPYLTHLETTLVAAYNLPKFISSTPNLVSAKLDIQDNCVELAFFANAPKLTHLHLDGRELHADWWSILARTLPQLTHLTIRDVEDVDQIGAEYEVAVDSTTNAYPCFPNLEHLAFTMTNGTFVLSDLMLPRLKHLAIAAEHPKSMPAVYPHLESLHITGAQCPSHVMRILDLLHPLCKVKFVPLPTTASLDPKIQLCSVDQLCMRFSGAGNRHVWRALLDGAPFPKREALVKESVVVALDRPSMQVDKDGDAQLIARVLAHLLGEQEPSSIKCVVSCDSFEEADRPIVIEQVGHVMQAIVREAIGAFVGVEAVVS